MGKTLAFTSGPLGLAPTRLFLIAVLFRSFSFAATAIYCDNSQRYQDQHSFKGHEHAYIMDPWNQLDLAIIIVSWLPLLIPSFDNFAAA